MVTAIARLGPLIWLWLFITPLAQAFTTLEATVDQNPVVAGQSFILEVVADDDVDTEALDTSPLMANFAVSRTSVSRSTQIVNFDARRETRWQILLLARTPGTTLIPALTVDGISSAPIRLQVLPQGAEQAGPKLAFLESATDRNTLYLGQPLTVTVKLFVGAELQRGALNGPTLDNALLRQLGDDQETSRIIDGRRFRVIERRYLVIPQAAGTLTLGPATFEGDMRLPNSRRDLFGRAQSRAMALTGDTHTIEVLPKPSHYQGRWLVADLVSLTDDLKPNAEYQAGQPITRTLTLTAVGAVEESLPELELALPDGLRGYPDKPQRQGGQQSGHPIARLTQSVAMVPNQAGTYTLPAVKVPWWNAQMNQQQWAEIPAKTITVVGEVATAPLALPAAPVAEQPGKVVVEPGYWPYLCALLTLLWLATLWWGWRRGQAPAIAAEPAPEKVNHSELRSALLAACKTSNAEQALNLLPRWASEHWNRPMTLAQLSVQHPELEGPLAELQANRYGRQQTPWQGETLLDWVQAQGKVAVKKDADTLPPLDPIQKTSR